MTYYILCTITYIISYLVPISYLLSCSGYMPMLYYLFLTYCFIIYFLIRSCIVIYFHFYCNVILYFPIFSFFRFMTYFIPCTITYIFSYTMYISCLISCSGYTPMLYFHSSFSYLYYRILSYYMLLFCTFHILSSYTIHILHIHLCVLILSYILCFRILSILFLYWFKTNTFISYLYFSYYVNFYLIFPISRRSIRLRLRLFFSLNVE